MKFRRKALERFFLTLIVFLAACSSIADSFEGELFPTQTPAPETLQPGPASTPAEPSSLAAQQELIRQYLFRSKPKLKPDFDLPLMEIPLDELQVRMPVQLFRVTEGPFQNETYLVNGATVLQLGTAFGGQGVNSIEIADLDQDGKAEMYFAYSFGSGIHQSRIAMYAPVYAHDNTFEAEVTYLGDLSLFKESDTSVGVRIVEADPQTLTLKYQETIGYLALQSQGECVYLSFMAESNLSPEIQEKLLFPQNGARPCF